MSGEDDLKPGSEKTENQKGESSEKAKETLAKFVSGSFAIDEATTAALSLLFSGAIGSDVGHDLRSVHGLTAPMLARLQPTPETPLQQSQSAYESELPGLLQSHRGKWVAYADGKRVRIASTQAKLYRHCLKDLGLTHDRFVVRRVIPDGASQIEFTLR